MKKFDVGKKYIIFDAGMYRKSVGCIEILNRTDKFVTYHDNFFGNTKKVKISAVNDVEKINGFYIGVFASDRMGE